MSTKPPFEEVVLAHGKSVLRVCRAILNAADADDAWSETFTAALRAYPRLADDANVAAWLVTIAHRKAIDSARRTARHAQPVAEPAAHQNAAAEDRDLDLARALADLPEKQRATIVYHYLAGLPYRAIADILGGSAEAARRAAADGIANLRKAKEMYR